MSGTPLRGIVGHHKNAGTWLKGYGNEAPSPLSLKLRLRLRADTWATLVRRPAQSLTGPVSRRKTADDAPRERMMNS